MAKTPLSDAARGGHGGIMKLLRGRSDPEADAEANYLLMSASSASETSSERV